MGKTSAINVENKREIDCIKESLAAQPPATEVERIIREEGIYSPVIAKYVFSLSEYNYYKSNGYIEIYHVDDFGVGRHVLIRDIDPKLVSEKGLTNMERMKQGKCAKILAEKNGLFECVTIHHIGQRSECYALVPANDHREQTSMFHHGKPNEDPHDKVFGEFRYEFWRWMEEQYRKHKKITNFVRDNSLL